MLRCAVHLQVHARKYMQEVYDCVVHNINVLYTSCFQIINKAAPKTEEHLTEDEKLQRSVSDD